MLGAGEDKEEREGGESRDKTKRENDSVYSPL